MSVAEQWKAAGQTTILLPSGFRVRGVVAGPTEVVRRRIMPAQLRSAVVALGGKMMSTLTEVEHQHLIEARRFQLAAFIREMAPPGTTGDEGWEKVELTVEDLGLMPQVDVELLDDFIMGTKTAEMITAQAEVALGLRDQESAERVAQDEEGATLDGWTEFRDDGRGGPASSAGGAVAPVAEPAAAGAATPRGVRSGRRAKPASGAAGSGGA